MKSKKAVWVVLLLLFSVLSVSVKGQFTFASNNGALTITAYTGPGGDVVIPSTTNGYPVTSIGDSAFSLGLAALVATVTIPTSITNIGLLAFLNTGMQNVTIGSGVVSIGDYAFADCVELTNVTIPDNVISLGEFVFLQCTSLATVTLGAGVVNLPRATFSGCSTLHAVTMCNGITNIGEGAFHACSLNNITVGNNVSTIGLQAFDSCTNLKGVFFRGNAPSFGRSVFNGATNATVYYLPGTTGWGSTFAGRPAVLWNPQPQMSGGSFGVKANQFGFNVTGTANIPLVIEACTSLANPAWTPLQTCTLTNGSIYFADPTWTNYPSRVYRIRSP